MRNRLPVGSQILLLDGAMGTALQSAGLVGGQLPEIFNLTERNAVEGIHRGFLEAGSRILTTNTFGANSLKLKPHGLTPAQIIKAAFVNARTAIHKSGADAWVAQCIGPTGKLVGIPGGITFDEACAQFREQTDAGVRMGADLFLLETFSDMAELKAAVLAVREAIDEAQAHLEGAGKSFGHTAHEIPVFCSVTFQPGERMLMGTDPATAVLILEDLGVDGVGVNCALGPMETLPIVEKMTKAALVPVFAQPNAGLPTLEEGQITYGIDEQDYTKAMMEMLSAGIALAGGCCGTTPAYLAALRQALESIPAEEQKKRFPALDPEWYAGKKRAAKPAVAWATGISPADPAAVVPISDAEKRKWRDALLGGDLRYPLREATARAAAGAGGIIAIDADVFEGAAEICIPQVMAQFSSRLKAPIALEGTSETLMNRAARYYIGKPFMRKDKNKNRD